MITDFSQMRERIVFLKPSSEDKNLMSEKIPKYEAFHPAKPELKTEKDCMVWAKVAPMTGREYEEAQKLREETTYNVETRYFEGINASMKIKHRGRILDIISVLDIESRRVRLKIVAKEQI